MSHVGMVGHSGTRFVILMPFSLKGARIRWAMVVIRAEGRLSPGSSLCSFPLLSLSLRVVFSRVFFVLALVLQLGSHCLRAVKHLSLLFSFNDASESTGVTTLFVERIQDSSRVLSVVLRLLIRDVVSLPLPIS